MSIKTLRASGSYIQADVVIGCNKYGSDVTVAVKLSRTDPTVQEVMAPLIEFLVATAKDHVTSAADEAEMQAAVKKRLDALLQPEIDRISKNVESRWEVEKQRLERTLSSAQADAAHARRQLDQLQKELAHAQAAQG